MPIISGEGITVEIDVVLTEAVSRSGKVTSSPIEDRSTISDHFALSPYSVSISGVCTVDAANKINNLSKMFNKGAVCTYTGRNALRDVVITRFDTDHGADLDKAFSFSMTLSQVVISASQEFTVATATTNAQNGAQINTVSNVGIVQPAIKALDAVSESALNATATAAVNSYTK